MLKIALPTLCENRHRETGLTTTFHDLLKHSGAQFEDIDWIVFAGGKMNERWRTRACACCANSPRPTTCGGG